MLACWILSGLALLLALVSFRGERRRRQYVLACLAARIDESLLPPATVIVPVKGPEEGLKENLASLAELDYPDYELIVAARAPEDIPEAVVPAKARVVLAGEGNPNSSEKINNLLAAVAAARPASRVFAFADSDGRVRRQWLRALVQALDQEGAGAASGYRWHLPERPAFWSLLRSVWNAPIAGLFGPGPNEFGWGGAMAIRRDLFVAARVATLWIGAISDDYSLTAAVKQAGRTVAFAPGAMVASVDHTGGRQFRRWITRQMAITRFCRPGLWRAGFAAHVVYCAGMVAAVLAALRPGPWGEMLLALQLALGMAKGAARAALARTMLPEYGAWFGRYGWAHTWLVPLATWVWLYSFLASAQTGVVEWRGIRYRLSEGRAAKL